MHKNMRFLLKLGAFLLLCLSLAPMTGCGFQKQRLPKNQTYVTSWQYRYATQNRHYRGHGAYRGQMPQELNIAPVSGYDGSGRSIAATAASQIGKPYVSGGISPSMGFDCSGLVYWTCRTNGIAIPRMSIEQASFGYQVNRKSLLPGDVLVFKTPRGYHSGIYVGNNSFVHSPNPRKRVRVETLAAGTYYDKYYMTARRVAR
ncbi:MAG: C40 family peptidase [Mailhella sp.]|nr:C40 family peptidase [Mailhella sp.]